MYRETVKPRNVDDCRSLSDRCISHFFNDIDEADAISVICFIVWLLAAAYLDGQVIKCAQVVETNQAHLTDGFHIIFHYVSVFTIKFFETTVF